MRSYKSVFWVCPDEWVSSSIGDTRSREVVEPKLVPRANEIIE